MTSPDPKKPAVLKRKPKAVTRRSDKQRADDEAAEEARLKAREQAAADEARTEANHRKLQYGFLDQNRRRGQRSDRGSGTRGGRGGFMGDRGVAQGQLSGLGSVEGSGRRVPGERVHEGPRERRHFARDEKDDDDGEERSGKARAAGAKTSSARTRPTQEPPLTLPSSQRLGAEEDERPSTTVDRPQVKKEESEAEDSGIDDGVEVIDLEELNLAPNNEGALLPIPAGRQEHVERQFHINTDSSTAIATGKSRSGRRGLDNEDVIKLESDDEQVVAGTDAQVKTEPSSSPELSKRSNRPARTPRPKGRAHSPHLTEEQKIQEANRRVLLEELGPSTAPTVDTYAHAQEASNGQQASTFNPRQDTLFLFQLPPRLPSLSQRGVKIKEEPRDDPMDTTGPEPLANEKFEEDELEIKEEETGGAPPATDKGTTNANNDLQPGFLGKMQVWKSGNVTLDWGGVRMVVRKGYDSNFAETVVGMNVRPKTAEENGVTGEYTGAAHSFGQVRGRMVVTPDFGTILGLEERRTRRKGRKKTRRGMSEDVAIAA